MANVTAETTLFSKESLTAVGSAIGQGPRSSDQIELTVIIPVYNEASTLCAVLDRVVEESSTKDIIVVDDGSTDGTPVVFNKWLEDWSSKSSPQHVCRIMGLTHTVNRGKGAAIRTALKHATSTFVIVQDADLEVSPTDYPALLKPLHAGIADIAVGYRTHSRVEPSRFAYGIGIQLLNLMVRVLYGVTLRDEACCFKLLRVLDIHRMNLECERFEFCPEVVAKAARLGLRFAEVPISFSPRTVTAGKKLRLRDGFHAIVTLWKFRSWVER
jgi:glycosyltransferase involved in cell wall biosynthesis